MDTKLIEDKWRLLAAEGSENPSFRIDGACIPDLFIGLQGSVQRCLILNLPAKFSINLKSQKKTNLSLELFNDTRWLVLKLHNITYADLFNDLIISIYQEVHQMNSPSLYVPAFAEKVEKWNQFFKDITPNRLSEEAITGLIGEMVVLRELLLASPNYQVNQILQGWRGPYNYRHDFVFDNQIIEVKTKELLNPDVVISSEWQMETETSAPLHLSVVNVRKDTMGTTLSALITEIKNIIHSKHGEISIYYEALTQAYITNDSINWYDDQKYQIISMDIYNCSSPDFPKLIKSNIPVLISDVKYRLNVVGLSNYIIDKKIFNEWS
ncbi:putative PD-(D/E)XK family protein DUF4420 [Chitinophaga dinghuensis]|uniref:Putative PD-(D/E)XK family protein DUF4420 n=1 Tax=Chitinophaga dinghuensis TaxID=1539050 RepID=A0A327W5I1_9BACT|nr:PD-(D/E)XK motif protein [Chitinophaga dinghuensis]RAJ83610.1 putative PD-(D/E)XK family protein DUF4420 [Chitinophaga dinghuensis]